LGLTKVIEGMAHALRIDSMRICDNVHPSPTRTSVVLAVLRPSCRKGSTRASRNTSRLLSLLPLPKLKLLSLLRHLGHPMIVCGQARRSTFLRFRTFVVISERSLLQVVSLHVQGTESEMGRPLRSQRPAAMMCLWL